MVAFSLFLLLANIKDDSNSEAFEQNGVTMKETQNAEKVDLKI